MTLKDVPTLLVYAFATSSIPLYFVENPYFRRLIELLSDSPYELPHRTALRSKLIAEGNKAAGLTKNKLSVS